MKQDLIQKSMVQRLNSLINQRVCTRDELINEIGLTELDIDSLGVGRWQLTIYKVAKIADYLGTTTDYLLLQSEIDLPLNYAKKYPF